MTRLARIVVVLICWLAAACASSLELADEAYQRRHWEAAAKHYCSALGDALPEQRSLIEQRLAESQEHAAASRLAQARQAMNLGQPAIALDHARQAHGYQPSAATQELMVEATNALASALHAQGEAAFRSGHWAPAIQQLEQAQRLRPRETSKDFLVQARAALAREQEEARLARERERAQALQLLLTQAEDHLAAESWAQAASAYTNAASLVPSELTSRKARFASLMARADLEAEDSQLSVSSAAELANVYREAMSLGVRDDIAAARLADFEVAHTVLTLHGALVLPVKPGSTKPWDGVGSLPNLDKLVAVLGEVSGPQSVAFNALATDVTEAVSGSIEAPDCFVEVRLGNTLLMHNFDARDENEFAPRWDLPIDVGPTFRRDPRVLSIDVIDADLQEHDTVGRYQATLGELVSTDGVRTINLVEADSPLSRGLIALQVSASRF